MKKFNKSKRQADISKQTKKTLGELSAVVDQAFEVAKRQIEPYIQELSLFFSSDHFLDALLDIDDCPLPIYPVANLRNCVSFSFLANIFGRLGLIPSFNINKAEDRLTVFLLVKAIIFHFELDEIIVDEQENDHWFLDDSSESFGFQGYF